MTDDENRLGRIEDKLIDMKSDIAFIRGQMAVAKVQAGDDLVEMLSHNANKSVLYSGVVSAAVGSIVSFVILYVIK